jgi:hypothetical protein
LGDETRAWNRREFFTIYGSMKAKVRSECVFFGFIDDFSGGTDLNQALPQGGATLCGSTGPEFGTDFHGY